MVRRKTAPQVTKDFNAGIGQETCIFKGMSTRNTAGLLCFMMESLLCFTAGVAQNACAIVLHELENPYKSTKIISNFLPTFTHLSAFFSLVLLHSLLLFQHLLLTSSLFLFLLAFLHLLSSYWFPLTTVQGGRIHIRNPLRLMTFINVPDPSGCSRHLD
jgi:hypothetical protein